MLKGNKVFKVLNSNKVEVEVEFTGSNAIQVPKFSDFSTQLHKLRS